MADDDHTESDCLFLVDSSSSFYSGFIVESDRTFCFYQHGFSWGIASEAVLHFSPTIYASGARVYYLTDLMYLFIILWMVMHMDSEKKKNLFIAGVVVLGVANFLSQYSIMLLKL